MHTQAQLVSLKAGSSGVALAEAQGKVAELESKLSSTERQLAEVTAAAVGNQQHSSPELRRLLSNLATTDFVLVDWPSSCPFSSSLVSTPHNLCPFAQTWPWSLQDAPRDKSVTDVWE